MFQESRRIHPTKHLNATTNILYINEENLNCIHERSFPNALIPPPSAFMKLFTSPTPPRDTWWVLPACCLLYTERQVHPLNIPYNQWTQNFMHSRIHEKVFITYKHNTRRMKPAKFLSLATTLFALNLESIII